MASSASERCGWRRAAGCLAAALTLGASRPADAAQPPPAGPPEMPGEAAPEPVPTLRDGTRRVRGRVVTPRDSQAVGVPGVWITLHRVARDAAGPLDSVRTGADGGYAFTYRPRGDARAVYFVAASRGGVAYFSPPLRHAVVEVEEAEVTVFDTTSRALPLTVRGRHLIVTRPGADGAREVLEVFELSNDSLVTAVPQAGSTAGVWSTALPRGARRFAVRESGDVPADGLVAVAGAAALMVPVAPGLRQIAFGYQLPPDALPLRLAVARATGVLEVLLEEPAATASGAGLAPVAPVALEGKSFRRYLAQDAPAGATIDVGLGPAGRPAGGRAWTRYAVPALLVLVGGGMAAALLGTAWRRAPARRRGPTTGSVPPRVGAQADGAAPAGARARDELLAALVALDDEFAASGDRTPAAEAAYARQRAAIKAELAGALAGATAAD